MDESTKSYGIRLGCAVLGAAIGFGLFGSEGKLGSFPLFFVCAWVGFIVGVLVTWDDSDKTKTAPDVVDTFPAKAQTVPLKEKTCPACISQVPSIAYKCKFCGTRLIDGTPTEAQPYDSEPIKASNLVAEIYVALTSTNWDPHFVLLVESPTLDGLFFQGYLEANGAFQVECASDAALHPRLNQAQRSALKEIGWDPPTPIIDNMGNPNFTKLMDVEQSEVGNLAELIALTIRNGYQIPIDEISFSRDDR